MLLLHDLPTVCVFCHSLIVCNHRYYLYCHVILYIYLAPHVYSHCTPAYIHVHNSVTQIHTTCLYHLTIKVIATLWEHASINFALTLTTTIEEHSEPRYTMIHQHTGFHTKGRGPWNFPPPASIPPPPPPENLKICIVSYSCMTLWQCPTNFFPPLKAICTVGHFLMDAACAWCRRFCTLVYSFVSCHYCKQ